MIGVYKIVNPEGSVYVGASKEVEVRISRYKKLNCKEQTKIYNSLLKYGVENHIFEIIEYCNIDELRKRENHYSVIYNVLDKYKGLNSYIPGVDGKKYIISEENCKKRSLLQKGKKTNEETRRKMSISQTGRKHHEDTKLKMSLNNKKTKIILNTQNGCFYFGTKDAAKSTNISPSHLKNMLNGCKLNKTNFLYI